MSNPVIVANLKGLVLKLIIPLKAYLKGVINLKFEIGDVIELDFGKEYIIVNECIIETKEYYLVLDKNDTENTIIIQMNKDSDEIKIVNDKEKLEYILKIMSDKK